MQKNITSFQNPLIKQIVLLQEKSRERPKTNLFVIEGLREISLAIKGGYLLKTLLFCSDIISEEEIFTLKESANNEAEFIEITSEIYEKLAYRSSTEGVLAIVHSQKLLLATLQLANQQSFNPHCRSTRKTWKHWRSTKNSRRCKG